jgi:hypothetical protein
MTSCVVFDSRRESELYYYRKQSPPTLEEQRRRGAFDVLISPFDSEKRISSSSNDNASQALEMQAILSSYLSNTNIGNSDIPVVLAQWPIKKKENKLVRSGPIKRKNGRALPEDQMIMHFNFK